jgi:hypothetical protein
LAAWALATIATFYPSEVSVDEQRRAAIARADQRSRHRAADSRPPTSHEQTEIEIMDGAAVNRELVR